MSKTASRMASAVALPEDVIETKPPNGLKRRQSDVDEDRDNENSKRRRTSTAAEDDESPAAKADKRATGSESASADAAAATQQSPPPPPTASTARDNRKKNGIADEKQRSKRLFGALLGNLNRPATSERASKRRNEIEARKKAELAKQDEEREEERATRTQRVKTKRARTQIEVDEEAMRARHRSLMHFAGFLQTRGEPRIYWRPWELLADEEERIEEQVKEARGVVEREVEEWEAEKRRRLKEVDGEAEDEVMVDSAERPIGAEKEKNDEKMDITNNVKERPRDEKMAGNDPVENTDSEAIKNDQEESKSDNVQDSSMPCKTKGEGNTEDETAETNANHQVEVEEAEKKDTGNSAAKEEEEVKDEAEDEGDHVVEGDEDTVIY